VASHCCPPVSHEIAGLACVEATPAGRQRRPRLRLGGGRRGGAGRLTGPSRGQAKVSAEEWKLSAGTVRVTSMATEPETSSASMIRSLMSSGEGWL